jgi:predicted N-formylglutamate amidohydrolase
MSILFHRQIFWSKFRSPFIARRSDEALARTPMFEKEKPSDIDAASAPDWPSPVIVENEAGASDWVLICEHASSHMPARYARLGLPPGAELGHIGWDIGAAALACALSLRLDAALALASYSRLLIDLNRPLHAPASIPEISERTAIPGNIGLAEAERRLRVERIFEPFHDRVAALIAARERAGRRTRLLAVHSFTPVFMGAARPWRLGVLAGASRKLAKTLLAQLQAASPGVVMALDEPYRVAIDEDYAIPVHGDARGHDALLIEVRNDELGGAETVAVWADRLAAALARI